MKQELRAKAEMLRKRGKSIKEIAKLLNVSQGTASSWCSKIILPPDMRARLDEKRRKAGLAALAPWIQKNREGKILDLKNQARFGKKDVGKMTDRDLFMLGLGLYWGEGYKRGSQECGFTNSDPIVIQTILAWFEQCYDVKIDQIRARLTINERYKQLTPAITQKWSNLTHIPENNFSKPSFVSGYGKFGKDSRTYMGTLRIKVSKGTSLRRRILASISAAGS